MPKLRPVRNQVVVQRVDPEKETATGIIIPDDAQGISEEAVVVALGSAAFHLKDPYATDDVKVGDRVFVEKELGRDIKLGGEWLTIIEDTDILAVIE